MSFQYDGLIFVFVVRRLIVFWRSLVINIIFNIDEQTKNSYEQMDEL